MPRYVDVDYIDLILEKNQSEAKFENRKQFAKGIREARRIISDFAQDNVQEVKHGKWIDVFVREVYIPDKKTTITLTEQKCSCCNVVTTFKGDKKYLPDFNCPNCGAKMSGKED